MTDVFLTLITPEFFVIFVQVAIALIAPHNTIYLHHRLGRTHTGHVLLSPE